MMSPDTWRLYKKVRGMNAIRELLLSLPFPLAAVVVFVTACVVGSACAFFRLAFFNARQLLNAFRSSRILRKSSTRTAELRFDRRL
jgi:hypothetical protein